MRNAILGAVVTLITVALTLVPLSPASAAHRHHRPPRLHAVRIALSKVGHPYVFGAAGPYAFDCSGLVHYAYHRAGFRRMPRTAMAQYRHLRHIPLRRMRRGDLIFDVTRSGYAYHVQIYLGHHHVVEAASPALGVRRAPVWHVRRRAATTRR